MTYRYTLEPYKSPTSRYRCPACNKLRIFTRYIDTETGQHLAEHVGKCDREIHCGYHFTPKQYFSENGIDAGSTAPRHIPKQAPAPPATFPYIPDAIFKKSLQVCSYEDNYFARYLIDRFGAITGGNLIWNYHIGTAAHWHGATVFWQVDIKGRVRAGKIMLYDLLTGKRIKRPYNHITWVHSVVELPGYRLQQCFFGEHLLSANPFKPVAIVESEKTAVIASAYMPQYIWIAAGSLSSLTAEKARVLKGRDVRLFPDLDGFDKWSSKAKELSGIVKSIGVSDLLEKNGGGEERELGLDIADYLMGSCTRNEVAGRKRSLH